MEYAIVSKDANGQPVTTSMAIALGTEVQHKNVLELVRRYKAQIEEFGLVEFKTEARSAGSHGGGDTVYAVLNEQQSTLLISFMRNSQIVLDFKVALVKSFYEMRTALTTTHDPLSSLPAEQRALVAVMVENAAIKAKQAELEATQEAQSESIKRIEAKQSAFENGHSFFTAMAFCALRGVKLMMPDMQRLGRLAASHSKSMGISIDKVRDARFGMVNAYHETALDAAFAEIHGGM